MVKAILRFFKYRFDTPERKFRAKSLSPDLFIAFALRIDLGSLSPAELAEFLVIKPAMSLRLMDRTELNGRVIRQTDCVYLNT